MTVTKPNMKMTTNTPTTAPTVVKLLVSALIGVLVLKAMEVPSVSRSIGTDEVFVVGSSFCALVCEVGIPLLPSLTPLSLLPSPSPSLPFPPSEAVVVVVLGSWGEVVRDEESPERNFENSF